MSHSEPRRGPRQEACSCSPTVLSHGAREGVSNAVSRVRMAGRATTCLPGRWRRVHRSPCSIESVWTHDASRVISGTPARARPSERPIFAGNAYSTNARTIQIVDDAATASHRFAPDAARSPMVPKRTARDGQVDAFGCPIVRLAELSRPFGGAPAWSSRRRGCRSSSEPGWS